MTRKNLCHAPTHCERACDGAQQKNVLRAQRVFLVRAPRGREAVGEARSARFVRRVREVSVAAPAFNEGAHLEALVRSWHGFLSGLPWLERFEFVICDDGSADDTGAVLERLSSELPEVRPVSHPRNRGAGAAVRSAIAATRLEWVLLVDGDGQFPLENLRVLAEALEDSEADVAHGFRRRKSDRLASRAGSWASGQLTSWLLGARLRDFNSALRLVRGDLLRDLPLEGRHLNYSTEIGARLWERGAVFVEVPVEHRPRASGSSSVRWRDGRDRLLFVAYLGLRRLLRKLRVLE